MIVSIATYDYEWSFVGFGKILLLLTWVSKNNLFIYLFQFLVVFLHLDSFLEICNPWLQRQMGNKWWGIFWIIAYSLIVVLVSPSFLSPFPVCKFLSRMHNMIFSTNILFCSCVHVCSSCGKLFLYGVWINLKLEMHQDFQKCFHFSVTAWYG